jgi:exocyst complex component 3
MPELGLEPAERMLAARKDIPRATQRAILEECRELHNSQIATMTSVTAASTAKKGLRF